jgi:hypothetical protein
LIYLPIMTQATVVTRRQKDDLLSKVTRTVKWTEDIGYQLDVLLEQEGQFRVYNVEFINDKWYLLAPTAEGYKTNLEGELEPHHWGTGLWPENHPQNPKNLLLAKVPSFGKLLEEGLKEMTSSSNAAPPPEPPLITKGKEKQKPREDEPLSSNGGNFRGKAPDVFDGDRTKSKAFISNMVVYFKINRNHPNIRNPYTRVYIALSFIKGPNVVNWVDVQFQRVEDNLIDIAGGDEMDSALWVDFVDQFKRAYVSTTVKESTYVKLQSLSMKGNQLDEYIANFTALIAELEWDEDGEIACHHFRERLPTLLVRQILQHKENPGTLQG